MTGTIRTRNWPWLLVGLAGAGSAAMVAVLRGEHVNAVWLLIAAVCVYLIAYRFYAPLAVLRGRVESWAGAGLATAACVASWGFFLYQGVTDPLGGVNTLWPLFGIANQMLAAIALLLGTVVLVRMGRVRFAWVTALPAAWLLACTGYAAWLKLVSDDKKIGFVAHGRKFAAALDAGTLLAPAQ